MKETYHKTNLPRISKKASPLALDRHNANMMTGIANTSAVPTATAPAIFLIPPPPPAMPCNETQLLIKRLFLLYIYIYICIVSYTVPLVGMGVNGSGVGLAG